MKNRKQVKYVMSSFLNQIWSMEMIECVMKR